MIALAPIQLLGLALVLIAVGWILADLVFPKAAAPKSREDAQSRKGAGS